ncbi:MAG TPA: hypothetical protein VFE14_04275 [Micromonosporaceae bacterium]|nr:hypothetical protein [Micromonosporaceae bacterium]
MSDANLDPSGNTEQFRAFVHAGQHEEPARRPRGLLIGGGIVVVLVIALVLWLALS